MLYRFCDLKLESNILLPELRGASGSEAELAFQLQQGPCPDLAAFDRFHEYQLPDGVVWLAVEKRGCEYLLRFPGLDFIVSSGGRHISCYLDGSVPSDTIRHHLLNNVIPLVLSKWQRPVLHASAVLGPQGAIAFLGMTGHGKSTLAATFSQAGFPLLTDDCFLLGNTEGQLSIIPSYPGLRVWPEVIPAIFHRKPEVLRLAHYTKKKRVILENNHIPFHSDPALLWRMYILAPDEGLGSSSSVTVSPLSPRESFIEFVRCAYRLDVTDSQMLTEEFKCLARIVDLTLLHRLAFPWDLSALGSVRDAILADLKLDPCCGETRAQGADSNKEGRESADLDNR